MVFFGTLLMGKVHRAPIGHYIATKFFHVCFIPVMPIDSYIVTGTKLTKFSGVPITLDGVSVLTAYLRCVFTLGMVAGSMGLAFFFLQDGHVRDSDAEFAGELVAIGVFAAACFVASYLLRSIRFASPAKADWMTWKVTGVRPGRAAKKMPAGAPDPNETDLADLFSAQDD